MKQNYIYNSLQLTAGNKVFVEGYVSYSRVSKHIEGDELLKDKERKMRQGMTPIDRPYTTITITDAKIRPVSHDMNNLTIDELYIQERFYDSKHTSNNKSTYLPVISQYDPATNNATQIDIEGKELAVGLHVILELGVFKPKNYAQHGVGLNSIIVMEPIKYYTASQTDYNVLGFTYTPLTGEAAKQAVNPQGVASQPAEAPYAQAAPAPSVAPMAPANPYSQVAPVAPAMPVAPVAPPMAPVQNVAPTVAAPASPWLCPNCGGTVAAGQVFCGGCGHKQGEAVSTSPYAPTGGINYDPNDAMTGGY